MARQFYELDKRFLRGDGAAIWVHFTRSQVRDAAGSVRLGIGLAEDITARKQAERERERLIAELQNAIAEVKTLHGLLPICANCKKIRDDRGYWEQVEVYLEEKTDVHFSHGICPECFRTLDPGYQRSK